MQKHAVWRRALQKKNPIELFGLDRVGLGGSYRVRTYDPLLVGQMLSQLS